MTCERWRDAISAMIDDEPSELDEQLVVTHVERCADCRAFQVFAERTRRTMRIARAEPMPDLAPRLVKVNAVADRLGRWSLARAALAIVAIEVIALSLPGLLLGNEADASVHAARHLGAFSVAYGVALLVVVARPARARTVLPVALVLAGTLLITAIVDVLDGHIPLLAETKHIPELASVLLVWLLATPTPTRKLGRVVTPHPASPLHIVKDDRRTG